MDGLPPGDAIRTKKGQPSKRHAASKAKQAKGALPDGFFDKKETDLPGHGLAKEHRQVSVQTVDSEVKQVKGVLPEGFFDNKEADLRARGIKPVKTDIKDEYKEFEKLIQEDLQVMDNRMEEEEVDAAEMIEEEEQLEQKSYKEKVEILKRKKVELRAARLAKRSKGPEVVSRKEPADEESSSDDDDGDVDKFTVDWRAQHL